MRRVLLDSNALDPMLNVAGVYEALEEAVRSAKLEVLYTHVTVDEIAATPDLEKRQWLLNLLVFLARRSAQASRSVMCHGSTSAAYQMTMTY